MSKFFNILGIVILIGCVFLFICFLMGPSLILFLAIVLAAVFAVLLIAVGDLMDRVDYLENTLEVCQTENKHEDRIMQIICPNCGKQYDMDYPKCPHCGNSLSEVKDEN